MLCIQHIRNGEALSYHWGLWHLDLFMTTARLEIHGFTALTLGDNPEQSIKNVKHYDVPGEYTFKGAWCWTDPADGEEVTILAGDKIISWNDRKG